jgi:hypothetical protein
MITESELLRDIEIAAEIIVRHGVKYAPLLDRLEQELATMRRGDDPLSRARAHLARAKGIEARP